MPKDRHSRRFCSQGVRLAFLELGTWNLELSFMPNVAFAVAEPAGGGNFLLREKLHAFFALHVQVAEEGIVPAVEGEPGHRGGDADVNADHAAVDAMFEFAGGF